MSKNLLRIKLKGRSILKLALQANKRDFTLTLPKLLLGKIEMDTHMSLHTGNQRDRQTFKLTSLRNSGKENIETVKNLFSQNEKFAKWVRMNGIDITGPRYVDYDTTGYNILWHFSFSLEGWDDIKYLAETKTNDKKFKYVLDIVTLNKVFRTITIYWAVGKNVESVNIAHKGNFDDLFLLKEKTIDDHEYTHLFLFKFDENVLK